MTDSKECRVCGNPKDECHLDIGICVHAEHLAIERAKEIDYWKRKCEALDDATHDH